VFEFGCGTGSTALHHASFVQKIVATDFSSNMIEIARRKTLEANITNVEFQCSTLEDFKAADASFDVVMANNILHLLEDPEQASRITYRLLKPGGVFVTSTGCLGDSFSHWRVMLIIMIIMRILRKAPFVNVLKSVTLENYFSNAGFEINLDWRRKKQAAFIILKKPTDG
jgi:ubiquinone/menaquinone biosynthesis C-methylase UbiE